MEFVFKTKEEFKEHVKLFGNEPRNYKILEQQKPKTEDINTEDINTEDINTEDINTEDINTEDINTEDINTEQEEDTNTEQEEDTNTEQEEDVNTQDINTEQEENVNNYFGEETNIFKIKKTLKDLEYGKYESIKFIEDIILENTYDNNLCSDISNIDLIKYYTDKKQRLKPLTKIFIDNIMLYKLFTYTDGTGKYLHKDVLSTWNKKVRRICEELNIKVVPHSVKFKSPVLYGGCQDALTRRSFKELIAQKPHIINNFLQQHNLNKDELNKCYIGVIKLELADEDFYTINGKLKELEHILSGFDNQIFIKDCDATKDYAGTFDKQEIKNKLLKHDNFFEEGNKDIGDYKTNNNHYFIVLENDKSVSKGTLTFIEILDDKILNRYKIYNKVFAQLSSPGVANSTGNHLHDFIHCPDDRLGETFKHPLALERGITRLEITLYKNEIPTTEEMEQLITDLFNIVDTNLYYYVPIRNLWKNITEHIINNLVVINRKAKLLYIVYYVNLQTNKITGIRFNIPTRWEEHQINNCINYVLSNYSYNILPCYLLEINNTYEEDYKKHADNYINKKQKKQQVPKNIEHGLTITNTEFTLKQFEKSNGTTQLSKTTDLYNPVKNNIDIQEAGLINTDFIIWNILTTKHHVGKLGSYPIKHITNTTNKIISTLSKKSREDKLKEKTKLLLQEDYIAQNAEDTQNILNKYRALQQEQEELYIIQIARETHIKDTKKAVKGVALSIKDLGDNLTIKAFYKRIQKDGRENIIVLRQEDNKAYYAPQYAITVLNNSENKNAFINYDDNVFGLDDFKPIITIKKDGKLPNGSDKWKPQGYINEGLKIPKSLIEFEKKEQIIKQQIQDISINKLIIPPDFKLKDSVQFDELEVNKEYTITDITHHSIKDKARFFFKVQGNSNIYRANPFLEDYLKNNNNCLLLKFKTLDLTYNKQTKHKELNIAPVKTDKKKKIQDIILSR